MTDFSKMAAEQLDEQLKRAGFAEDEIATLFKTEKEKLEALEVIRSERPVAGDKIELKLSASAHAEVTHREQKLQSDEIELEKQKKEIDAFLKEMEERLQQNLKKTSNN